MNENVIKNKSFVFAADAIRFSENLRKIHLYWFADQLSRSSASIGANVMEAQNAESRRDFIHKMKIAIKEAYEAKYWFELCSVTHPNFEAANLRSQVNEIILILSKIIFTSIRNEKAKSNTKLTN
jgi:four helix bundle protein